MCASGGRTLQISARESVYLCAPPVRIVTDCKFEEQSKTHLHYLICVAATSRPGLVFFLVFKTSAGTSDVVGRIKFVLVLSYLNQTHLSTICTVLSYLC